LKITPKNYEYYLAEGLSKEEILAQCQISEKELDLVLSSDKALELQLIEVHPGRYGYIESEDLWTLID
jgi:hypothetical protein